MSFYIKKRNPVFVILAIIFTFGIYGIYWIVKTKGEINSLGADIPTAFLIIVPIANLFFFYKYCEGFSVFVKKDNQPILWFLLYVLVAPLAIILIQIELNNLADSAVPSAEPKQ